LELAALADILPILLIFDSQPEQCLSSWIGLKCHSASSCHVALLLFAGPHVCGGTVVAASAQLAAELKYLGPTHFPPAMTSRPGRACLQTFNPCRYNRSKKTPAGLVVH